MVMMIVFISKQNRNSRDQFRSGWEIPKKRERDEEFEFWKDK
jgi:hypothetical protein